MMDWTFVSLVGEGGGEQESVAVAHLCTVQGRHHGRSSVEGIRGRQHTVAVHRRGTV
jgi:hypothetical protein